MLGRALGKLRDGLVSLAYPQMCGVCGGPVETWTDGVACADCWDDPQKTCLLLNKPVCDKCGAPLASFAVGRNAVGDGETVYCGSCDDAPYSAAISCGVYSGAIEASVLFLKTRPYLCGRLRSIIAETFARSSRALAADLIIPVPLARARRKERGFNQATVIAKLLRSQTGMAMDEDSLIRIKHTGRHRAGMDAIDRARSVNRAFQVARPDRVAGSSVLLVDDLFTTGSTVESATTALLEAGADRVSVFTIARVVRSD